MMLSGPGKFVPAPEMYLSPFSPKTACHWNPNSAAFVASTLTIIDSM